MNNNNINSISNYIYQSNNKQKDFKKNLLNNNIKGKKWKEISYLDEIGNERYNILLILRFLYIYYCFMRNLTKKIDIFESNKICEIKNGPFS
jgi:thermostable 8-oxoguanine DNA glycosylase